MNNFCLQTLYYPFRTITPSLATRPRKEYLNPVLRIVSETETMKFEAGKSGNPGGRPKVTLPDGRSLTDLCRAHTEDAVKALVDICTSEDAPKAAVVAASTAILDRGWGKPTQAVELTGANGGPVETRDMSDAPTSVLEWLVAKKRGDAATQTVQ